MIGLYEVGFFKQLIFNPFDTKVLVPTPDTKFFKNRGILECFIDSKVDQISFVLSPCHHSITRRF